jgi:hypothetical protein
MGKAEAITVDAKSQQPSNHWRIMDSLYHPKIIKENFDISAESLLIQDVAREMRLELSSLQDLVLTQTERIDRQEQHLKELSQGLKEIAKILQQQQSNSGQTIDAVNQNLDVLGKATITTYQQLIKTNNSKELLALRAEQQAFRKIADTVQRTLEIQSDNLVTHLDWKRTITIIFITALLSASCCLAIVQLVPNGWTNSTPTKPAPKKTIKSQNRS